MSKRIAIAAAAICCSAGLATPALAAGGVTGRYATTIRGDKALGGSLNGRWVVDFAKAGAYTITFKGAIVVRGRSSSTRSTVSFGHESGPASCPTAGRYRFAVTGRRLRLTRIADTCPGRIGVLAHTLTKTG